MSGWKAAAAKARLSKADVAFMADAFEHEDLRAALALGATAARHRLGGVRTQKETLSTGSAIKPKRAAAKKKPTPRKRPAASGK